MNPTSAPIRIVKKVPSAPRKRPVDHNTEFDVPRARIPINWNQDPWIAVNDLPPTGETN